MRLESLISQRDIDNIDKEYNEINWIDMIDDNKYQERTKIGENDEDRPNDDINVFKLVTLSPRREIYNIEREYDEINRIYIIDDRESDERDQIGENDAERLTDDIEVFKLVKLSSKKYIYNVDK